MLALLGISTLASLVASSVLGVRLLRMASRTRQVPEFLMGAALLGAGFFGYVFMLVGTGAGDALAPEVAHRVFLIGYAAISGGVILTYLFVWRVFEPTSVTARIFVGIVCPIVAVTGLPFALPAVDGSREAQAGLPLMIFWLGHSVRIGSGLWGFLEAGRYYTILRRRLRLGLADPVVTNRIALWALSSLGGMIIFASTAISNASGSSMKEVMSPGQILLISSVAFAVSACQWLAFLPPRRYRAWVSRRAGAIAS